MNRHFISIFAIGVLLGFVLIYGVGQLEAGGEAAAPIAETSKTSSTVADKSAEPVKQAEKEPAKPIAPEATIFVQKTCITCHAISEYGSGGGEQGPDLTSPMMGTYIKEKYGISLREYLDNPKSSVMAPILANLKLTDEEKDKIAELLTEKAK
ncbi:c-type cytochrome [Schinkia sp. CFF1]